MKEKLPKVYANRIEKEIKNNEKVYISKEKKELTKEGIINLKERKDTPTITQKINKILNTKKYIYKIPVRITMKEPEEEITTKIIGKNKTHIITIDNELIQIKNILDIEISEN